jgi:hypothetical protein
MKSIRSPLGSLFGKEEGKPLKYSFYGYTKPQRAFVYLAPNRGNGPPIGRKKEK